jgi:hypothetical protein
MIPEMAKPLWLVFPEASNLERALCPRIEPIKDSVPKVMKIQEIETASEAIARSLPFCSRSTFGFTVSSTISSSPQVCDSRTSTFILEFSKN